MWRDNLLDIIADTKLKPQQIAERGNLPIKTVTRIIKGETLFPSIDTLERLATALNCSLGDILAGTRAFVGNKTLADLQDEIEKLTSVNESLTAQMDLVLAENTILKDEVKTLNSKVELLTMQLSYKDEIIALHKIIEQERHK